MWESDFVECSGREIHVRVANRSARKTVICWHGLARNSGDFHELGSELAEQGYRVLAPDTLGRGLSQWAENPAEEYNLANYISHLSELFQFYELESFDWVGTSMGGLMGLLVASVYYPDRINRLVLNDIGPEVPAESLRRINQYINEPTRFSRLSDFERRIRQLYAPFGPRSATQWHDMAIQSSRRNEQGDFVMHYDPAIGHQFQPAKPAPDLWTLYEQIQAPMLVVHGMKSDVLTSNIVAKMQAIKPQLQYYAVEYCGHAPGLHDVEQIQAVTQFLQA